MLWVRAHQENLLPTLCCGTSVMKYHLYQTSMRVVFVLGGKIAPIFFNTLEDAGSLPIECDVSSLNMGDEIILKPHAGEVRNLEGELLTSFELKTEVIMDEVRANGRINLIIGRQLTDKARETLGLEPTDIFVRPNNDKSDAKRLYIGAKNGR